MERRITLLFRIHNEWDLEIGTETQREEPVMTPRSWLGCCVGGRRNFGSKYGGRKSRRQGDGELSFKPKFKDSEETTGCHLALEMNTKLPCHLPEEHIFVGVFLSLEIMKNTTPVLCLRVLVICSQFSIRSGRS